MESEHRTDTLREPVVFESDPFVPIENESTPQIAAAVPPEELGPNDAPHWVTAMLIALRNRIELLEQAVFAPKNDTAPQPFVTPGPAVAPFADVPLGKETDCPQCGHHFTVGRFSMGCPNPNCRLHA